MDTGQVIGRIRRLITLVDAETSEYEDETLLLAVEDGRRSRAAKNLASMNTLSVDTDKTSPTYGISPEPTEYQGELLALWAAVEILGRAYRGRVDRGELGVSWTSGLESESTISAAKAYSGAVDALARQADDLLLAVESARTNVRVQ